MVSVAQSSERGLSVLDTLACPVCGAAMGTTCDRDLHCQVASCVASCPYCCSPKGQACALLCPLGRLPNSLLEDRSFVGRHAGDRLAALVQTYTCPICEHVRLFGPCNVHDHVAFCSRFVDCRACGSPAGTACRNDCGVDGLVESVARIAWTA
jgi:hypothetical protein